MSNKNNLKNLNKLYLNNINYIFVDNSNKGKKRKIQQ